MGYFGCDHCVTGYKRQHLMPLDEEEKWFNDRHALIRSRIERLFSFMDIWRIFSYCEHNEVYLERASAIALNVFYIMFASESQYDDCKEHHSPEGGHFAGYECNCQSGCTIPKDATDIQSDVHAMMMEMEMEYEPKGPSKGSTNPTPLPVRMGPPGDDDLESNDSIDMYHDEAEIEDE